jgi:hypothetical protein
MTNTTWNPADLLAMTLSGGNLLAASTAAASAVRSVAHQATGKYYWEYTLTNINQLSTGYGIANSSASLATVNSSQAANAAFVNFQGVIFFNGSNSGTNIGQLANHGIVGVALDMTGKLLWLRSGAAGNWNGSSSNNPATGVGGLNISAIAGSGIYALFCTTAGTNEQCTANFGDAAFAGGVPSGFTSGFPATLPASAAQARTMVMA